MRSASSEGVGTSLSSSESDDSTMSTLEIKDWSENAQTPVEHERRGWRKEMRGVAYHRWASIRRTHFAVIFSLSRTLIVGISLYFSCSEIGRMLANQYGNNAGSSGGEP